MGGNRRPVDLSHNICLTRSVDAILPPLLGIRSARSHEAGSGRHGPDDDHPTRFSTAAYNERDVTDKPRYIQALPRLADWFARSLASRWNRRYATLLSLDRWIGTSRQTLADEGVLDRTIFILRVRQRPDVRR